MAAALKKQPVESDAEPDRPAMGGDAAPYLLQVSRSVRGQTWQDRLKASSVGIATTIAQQHGVPELLGRVLAARDVGVDEVELFLNPTIKSLMPNPSSLQDMDKATKRIADAIEAGTKIAVFGDYDVDGACSAALWAKFLRHDGCAVALHIPDRILEGYGPNPDALNKLIDDGAGLIITVDCGTTSGTALAAATARDVDVVVIDHHQADETLPEVHAIVNPNRQDDLSGQGHLCAAGVVFLVLASVVRELKRRDTYNGTISAPDLLQLLDLVALATVADVVPLKGLNRAFVTKGLMVMKSRNNVGLRALADAAGLSDAPSPYHLGYILGPRINAGGRIGNAGLGAQLLSDDNETEAAKIAAQLDKLNRDRKDIETDVLEAAVAKAELALATDPDLAMLVVDGRDWHKGVVGLVASRLVERFHRPTCVIAWEQSGDGATIQGTGSLRSTAGVDIGGAIRQAVDEDLLVKGGGHAMAAGLTVTRGKLDALKVFLNREVAAAEAGERQAPSLSLDGALTPSAANHTLVGLLEQAGPYGQGNPQPSFAFPSVSVRFAKVVGGAHVRCALQAGDGSRIDAIAFRAADQPLGELLLTSAGMPIHVAGQLRRDTWGGRDKIELQILDAADPRASK